jgi:phosphatidate cytidylyltransferase
MEPIASIGIIAAAAMPLLPAYIRGTFVGTMLFVVVAAVTVGVWTVALFASSREAAPERVGHVLSGLLFSTVGMVALSSLRSAANGLAWAAMVLVTTWSNDTFAYVGGRVFGRHKLWPSVSPHKTWEGLFVGFLGGMLGTLVIRRWLPREMTLGLCLAIGAVGGVAAPVGDLCKSVLKRAYHVKDTGRLLPGHGGVLDRIDGVLFVAPALWLMRALWLWR